MKGQMHTNTKEELDWWDMLDKNCPNLSKSFFSIFGTVERRISQLYAIRETQRFTLKTIGL
jgi:hypothetical protein